MAIKVVVVDDELDIRALLRLVIEGSGSGIEICGEAGNARDAFDVIAACEPDVVILDERLPQMSGCDLARQLVRLHPGIEIILCSAYVDIDLKRRAEVAGVSLCLTKGDFRRVSDEVLRLASRHTAPAT